MPMLYVGLMLAVVVLVSAIGVYVYARRNASAQYEHKRRQRAVLDDFGDGAVWQMGHRSTNPIRIGMPVSRAVIRRGFLPRIAVSFLILIADRNEERRGEQ